MPRYLCALCALVCLMVAAPQAMASLGDYTVEVTTGSSESVSSGTTLWAGYPGSREDQSINNVVTGVDLPFSFRFDGVMYDRVSISSNGLIGLGNSDVTSSNSNSLTSTGAYPAFAPWWDELTLTGGAQNNCSTSPSVSWAVNGSAPNRVFVVEWRDVEVTYRTAAFSTFQVRLYEGTNFVEFYYGDMSSSPCWDGSNWNSTSATIGIAASDADFISVIPDYSSIAVDRSSSYDWVDLWNEQHRIAEGTVYRFAPCNISLTGNTAQGGTRGMLEGDVLLASIEVQRGNTGAFQPFSVDNIMGGCDWRDFAIEITGPDAADYSIDMTSGSLGRGESTTPTISFTPSALGRRNATLTITDNNYFSRTFSLAGTGSPRIEWLPNMADGATAGLADKDTLFSGIIVVRRTSRDFSPITLHNWNDNASAPAAEIVVTLDSAGEASTQYELIGATTASLLAGESFVPVIRFTGEGVGPQEATLYVDAEGERRSYTLRAISGAPAIAVTANGIAVDAATPAMNLVTSCVGTPTTIPFVVRNYGTLPMSVNDIDMYLTDTTYAQGTPLLPLMRDARGRPIPMVDYTISATPGGAPVSLPFSLGAAQSRQLYMTFVASEPGKRFGRAFIRTNAENLYGQDTNAFDNTTTFPSMVLGLFTTDLTARAVGSQLASNGDGLRIRPVVFPSTPVGDTAMASFTVANTGACDLRINRNKLRIFSGDVNEFRVVSSMRNSPFDASTGDYVLAPGMVDTIAIRFTPSRAGTRLATLWIQTNDSTLVRPGLAERGAYYVDLHGRGQAGLEGRDLTLAPVIIGGSVTGSIVLENTLTVAVGVQSVEIVGGDASEFSSVNWPALPTSVLPGSKLSLGIRLTPTGIAGARRTSVVLVTTTGDTIVVAVRGEAGTQTLVVSPTSMFENTSLLVGQSRRQTLMISNTGTLPVRITGTQIAGPDSLSYRIGSMPRLDLEAGQTEYLEVTFAPIASGQTSAQIVVTASTGQSYVVMLGGEAVKIRVDDGDPVSTTAPGDLPVAEPIDERTAHPTLR